MEEAWEDSDNDVISYDYEVSGSDSWVSLYNLAQVKGSPEAKHAGEWFIDFKAKD